MGIDGCGLPAGAARCVESGPHIGHWTAKRLGTVYTEQAAEAVGLVRDGEVVAGVIYEAWNGASIQAHIVVEATLTRHYLWAIFHYPFEVCGVRKIICPVAVSNARSARLAERMGFACEARLTDCAPDGDIDLYTLARADCRFLGGSYRKIIA